jgi:hypothetical protein
MHIVSELPLGKGASKTCFSCVRECLVNKTVIIEVSRNLDINVWIKVNDMIMKEMDKCTLFILDVKQAEGKWMERSIEEYRIILNFATIGKNYYVTEIPK